MTEVCSKCGLPKDLCICETIARESEQIIIKTVKKKFGKIATIVDGIRSKNINLKDIVNTLKNKLACGGTIKNNTIELQGNHVEKVKNELIQMGFSSDTILIKNETRK